MTLSLLVLGSRIAHFTSLIFLEGERCFKLIKDENTYLVFCFTLLKINHPSKLYLSLFINLISVKVEEVTTFRNRVHQIHQVLEVCQAWKKLF